LLGSLPITGTITTEFPDPAWRLAVVGETDSVIADTVIGADPDLEPSATEVAVTVTVRSLAGGVLGAV